MSGFNKGLASYVLIFFASTILALLVYLKSENDYNAALKNYRHNSQAEAELASKKLEDALNLIYQNIRTISFLPSVKKIDRHGTNLDADAYESIQQIYNNLASNVAISEVYVVPKDIDPDVVDPETGETEIPILMFDQLVVSNAGECKVNCVNEDKPEEEESSAEVSPEEEIYEYHLFENYQMPWLKKNYPRQTPGSLDLPVISGPEVITCDDTDYVKTRLDADRSGIIFSVPFYDMDGLLKGTISAIIRTNALKNILPETDYALVNPAYHYVAMSNKLGQEKKSLDWIRKGKADPGLLFSNVLPISSQDKLSKWAIWVGYPDEKFLQSGEAVAIRNFSYAGYGLSLFLAIFGMVFLKITRNQALEREKQKAEAEKQKQAEIERQQQAEAERQRVEVEIQKAEAERQRAEVEKQKVETEKRKAEAEAEKQKRIAMHQITDKFEGSVKEMISNFASSALQMQGIAKNMTKIATDTRQRSITVSNVSNEAVQNSGQIASAAEELSASIKEISLQTQKSSHIAEEASSKAESAKLAIESLSEKADRVTQIIQFITDIAEQINLLALNATIQAARAGEAGKGFAVVAGEVKGLANQVSKATDEITTQVNAMQEATKTSVDSVMEIIDVIDQVSGSTSSVASAVEEQSFMTNEIAQNITHTDTNTQAISQNIASVQEGADKTGNIAQDVQEFAKRLSEYSNLLQDKVDNFLATVRSE